MLAVTAPESAVCIRCGTALDSETDPVAALAWVAERDRGATTWLCPKCARQHARDIEGKLPSEYW
jgi:uncharacterized protein with PIN domain